MVKYLLTLVLLAPTPAFAHKLNLFAQARGATIVGRAYFTGDIAARKIDVTARDPSGRELGRAKTDDEGHFTLEARRKVDYHLAAETPDGHAARYVLSSAELPDSLPADSASAATPRVSSEMVAATNSSSDPVANSAGIEALQKQIEALRSQIDQSEQRLRFRDVLGGIGYILGLAGIGFYFKARRSKLSPMTRKETTD